MSEQNPEPYILPGGVINDFQDALVSLICKRPAIVLEHRAAGCRACLLGPMRVAELTYEDLHTHWKLRAIPMEPCYVCNQPYPIEEYITCDLAPVCRHCQVAIRKQQSTSPH